MTTVRQALQQAYSQLLQSGSDTSHLDSEIILGKAIGKSRTWLHTWPESSIDDADYNLFVSLIQRRADGEPVAHIVNKQDFWSLTLKVTADTLIPRPETEVMVEQALEFIPRNSGWRVADMGTGSGAIAIAIASERPDSTVIATDRSSAALSVAKENGADHNLHNIEFREGEWFAPFSDSEPPYQMILSNPPYVAQEDPHLGEGDLRYESDTALVSGEDGVDDLSYLISNAEIYLASNGILMVEHGYDQGKKVRSLFKQNNFSGVTTLHDLAGLERISYGTRV